MTILLLVATVAATPTTLEQQWEKTANIVRESWAGNLAVLPGNEQWKVIAEETDKRLAEYMLLVTVESCDIELPSSYRSRDCGITCYWSLKACRNGLPGYVPEWAVDPWLVIAIAWWETRGSYLLSARGRAGERGPWQALPSSCLAQGFRHIRERVPGTKQPTDRALYEQAQHCVYELWGFGGSRNNWEAAIRGYNGGPNWARKPVTKRYYRAVHRRWQALKATHLQKERVL